MARKRDRFDNKRNSIVRSKLRVFIAISIGMSLAAASAILAQLGGFRAMTARNSNSSQKGQLSPSSLNSNAPSKEYVYAGGRLVATEEPVGTTISAPTNLRATTNSSSQIKLTWTAPVGAVRYEVQRSTNFGAANNGFSTVSSTVTSIPYFDNVTTGAAYIYRVRAFDSNDNFSSYSNIDLATAIAFVYDPVVAQTTVVKESHITQLRQAIDYVRIAAGLSAATWTDPPPLAQVVYIKKVHVDQLRSNLDAARSVLSLPAPSFTDTTIVQFSTQVKAAHIQELRQLVKGYRTMTG